MSQSDGRTLVPTPRRNIHMIQNILLIWLDGNINENNADCQNTITQLQRVIHSIHPHTDSKECIKFLESVQDEKVCLIISGSLGQQVVPQIHMMPQVDTIFIFCGNKQFHETWAKNYEKIKGVFTDITLICEALKRTARRCERNVTPISVMCANMDVSKHNLDQLDPTFMYTQIMKEILVTINFEQKHIEEYLHFCRKQFANDPNQLCSIREFERSYHKKSPIWWYTYQCDFLYPLLNRALRALDVDIIIKMGFFIHDLHLEMDKLYKDQYPNRSANTNLVVYRGQGLSKTDFDKLRGSVGGLLAFNNFLSTSTQREVALGFLSKGSINSDMFAILFVMTVHPSQSTTPFASIAQVSDYGKIEDEVLFSMNSIFRIKEIQQLNGGSNMFQVKLTLTRENDKDLSILTNSLREEIPTHLEGWFRLGLLLRRIGEHGKAQQVYEILLAKETVDNERAILYNQLGLTKDEQGDNNDAISYFKKAAEIFCAIRPPNDPDLAACYNNIAGTYDSAHDYDKALFFYQKALEIWEQKLPSDHPDLAGCHSNIGMVYCNLGSLSKALASYHIALAIREHSLPKNHPTLGSSYYNLASLYENMSKYSQAYSFYQKAVRNAELSLPSNHPTLIKRRKSLDKMKKHLS